VLAEGLRRT